MAPRRGGPPRHAPGPARGGSDGDGGPLMEITVLGATGGTGRHLVAQALQRGHTVRAIARDPSRITADLTQRVADDTSPARRVVGGASPTSVAGDAGITPRVADGTSPARRVAGGASSTSAV